MTVVTNSILNPVGSIEMDLFHFDAPKIAIPDLIMKYTRPDRVLKAAEPSLKELIDAMMTKMKDYDDRSIVIDYKVRSLRAGDPGSGIYGWHIDCTNNLHDTFDPETHLIYSTVIGTSFATNPINASIYKNVKEVIDNEVIIEKVSSTESVHRFTSKVLHNCPIIQSDTQRILIRVTSGFNERLQYEKRSK